MTRELYIRHQFHVYMHCAGSEFILNTTLREHHVLNLWTETCPLRLRAYNQLPSCRRISGGLLAQVALLPHIGRRCAQT